MNVVEVPLTDVRIEYEVRFMDFQRTGGSPRELSDRHRIRCWGFRFQDNIGHQISNPS
jgi:hypothetical protein